VPPGNAAILGPTYKEHARAAAVAGHHVSEVHSFDALGAADLAVVVNPNNPDGRVVSRSALLGLARHLDARGGLLVVDEAFMDVGPRAESVADAAPQGGLVVLRSFGKFFGLAGVRLGFAIAAPRTAARLAARLGPWAVAGAALEYGLSALADKGWQETMRHRLAQEATRLDKYLANAGVGVTGGTSLFRHVTLDGASRLYRCLGGHGVLVRAFADRPRELRCGLPGNEAEWKRLAGALAAWRERTE
jgi:cobalamin biosynthetic protein CobC